MSDAADKPSVMQALYESEINVSVATLWDGGFDVALGDPVNGFKAEATCRTWAEAEAWLAKAAIEHYPNSAFAKARR